jgi:mRNA interferase RelE/StbE
MSYDLAFLEDAMKEWRKLDHSVREQFKKKLAERVANPKVASARLYGSKERYKIKLRSSGYRLVYGVRDQDVLVVVVAIGKRDRNSVYLTAVRR